MKIKTNELTELALDWAVAKCKGRADPIYRYGDKPHHFYISGPQRQGPYEPSTNWLQGGPIIERNGINLFQRKGSAAKEGKAWLAYDNKNPEMTGPTPLIAAMRCYVASKLGNTVDVPEELA